MPSAEVFNRDKNDAAPTPAFLVMDTESVPDGRLLARVKYAGEQITEVEAIERAREEARELSYTNSDFLPVTFQYPVSVCMLRVGSDFRLQQLTCLDAPKFRPRQIVEAFWRGVATYKEKYKERIKLVTFNGRGFDLPLLELAAFRYGCSYRDYFQSSRNRYQGGHLDLMEQFTNYGAMRFNGGLNLLSKMLGNPGKMEMDGSKVYELYREGRVKDINDYCMFDTLDTYFVFLRTRVMVGEFDLAEEHRLTIQAKEWLASQTRSLPALERYLENWSEWTPWP